jgi:hypothetical protein
LADSMGITLAFQPFGGNEAEKGVGIPEDADDE